ncbi:conserved hypothetical protein [Trichinella spiralis]|nr:conserved hypothetical protein [Trichinella spiralis]XP_003367204.1 conserved hypothetical protein [Trichinella spiralis]XP_003367780.1 conserved hypothetical protein [Trichinella spiralis]XP_003368133.1 conserved hypothetical protein [Trichinella spiralis]
MARQLRQKQNFSSQLPLPQAAFIVPLLSAAKHLRTLLVTLIDQKCTVRRFESKDNLHKQVCKRFIRQRTQRRLILVKIAPSAPSVCLSTVSRPVELSLQSSFQLSLAVLVRYRSLLGEIYHPLWAAVSSNPTRLGAATPCTKHRSLWVLHPL